MVHETFKPVIDLLELGDSLLRADPVLPSTRPKKTESETTPVAKVAYEKIDLKDGITRPNGEVYLPRKFDATTDVAFIRAAYEARMPVLLSGSPGCLAGDTIIQANRAKNGFAIRLDELVRRQNGGITSGHGWQPDIPTMVQREVDGVVRLGEVKAAWESGIKMTYTVTTDTGRSVRATDEHPFLTERGWLRLDQLVVGDLVHVNAGRNNRGRTKPQYKSTHTWFHPRQRKGSNNSFRMATHRLVMEASLNGLPFDDYVTVLRTDAIRSKEFFFLTPEHVVHHIDGDVNNNELSNLMLTDKMAHLAEHDFTNNVLEQVGVETVVSVTEYGEEMTYDIEVADDPHNFMANGFVVHNTGKSAMIEAALEGVVTVLGTAETEAADFLGSWIQKPDGHYEWIDGPLIVAMEAGTPMLIDEIALIDSRSLAVVYSVMDGRKKIPVTANPARGTVEAKDGFVVYGACNPNVPGAVMSDALLSRFTMHIEVRTDWDLAKRLGIGTKALTVAKNLATQEENGYIVAAPQLRELLAFKAIGETFGEEVALRNFIAQARPEDRDAYIEATKSVFGVTVKALTL